MAKSGFLLFLGISVILMLSMSLSSDAIEEDRKASIIYIFQMRFMLFKRQTLKLLSELRHNYNMCAYGHHHDAGLHCILGITS